MISELYLNRAVKIRKEYLKLIKDINSYEKIANDLITSISDRKKDLEDLLENLNQHKISNEDVARQKLDEIVLLVESTLEITCSGQLRYEPNGKHFVIESKVNSGHSIPWALLLEGYLNKKGVKTKMIYSDHVHNGERIHIKVDSKTPMAIQ